MHSRQLSHRGRVLRVVIQRRRRLSSDRIGRRRLHLLTEGFVLDIVFVVLSIAFFAVSIGYVAACDRLMK
jgi:hypothetical protein